MRIFAFSDWRTQPIDPLYDILAHLEPSPDLILYAGDDVRRFVSPTHNHFHGFAQTADAELGFVLGNDDRPANLQNLQLETSRVTDLHQSPLSKHDYTIVGQSGDIGESAMGFIQYTENQAAAHLEEKYTEIDTEHLIVVSHSPPHGALDYAQRHNNQRIGSHAVREFAADTDPVFILCGHVHQFGGQTADRDFGPVLNVASHDFEGAAGRIALIEIPESEPDPDIETTHTHLQELARSVSGLDDTLSATSSLRILTQIGQSRAEELQEIGIESIEDVATQPADEFISQTMIPESCLERAHNHALAFHHDETRIRNADQYEQIQNDEPVLIDIETNLEQSQVWCIGLYSYRDDEFTQLVSLDDERSLLADFRDYLKQQEMPTVVYYAGNSFDENRLLESAERTNVKIAEIIDEWVDLCLLARRTIFLPRKGHELDTIASGLGYIFAHPDVTGLEIGSVYSTYQSEGEVPEEGWEKYLRYNLDDVLAIKHIFDVVAESDEVDNCYTGTLDNTNTPEDRTQYQIATVPIEDEPKAGENEGSSTSSTDEDPSDTDVSPQDSRDPYELLEEGDSIAKWTEANPVNNQASSDPVCSACGKSLVEEDQRKELASGEVICRGGCSSGESHHRAKTDRDPISEHTPGAGRRNTSGRTSQGRSQSEQVTCHECEKTVSKQIATGKYRINDGQTLWYCPSCE